MKYLLLICFSTLFILNADAQEMKKLMQSISMEETQEKELGKVRWLRDYEVAKSHAAKSDRPIFILFQEVPGCHTCTGYGDQVLSHPLLVDAIENLFVPLAIFNNKDGKDAEILDLFQEPSWNNPVVRIIDKNEKALTKRLAGDYTVGGLTNTLVAALKRAGKPIPTYLILLADEWKAMDHKMEKGVFAMHCFWTGEAVLGGIDGVVKTESGFMGGKEVVRFNYDPEAVSFSKLLHEAGNKSCAGSVFYEDNSQKEVALEIMGEKNVKQSSEFRKDREQKYHLLKSNYRFVPMTELQAARLNSALASKQDPTYLLSPRQQAFLQYYELRSDLRWKSLIGVPLELAWDNAMDKVKAWD